MYRPQYGRVHHRHTRARSPPGARLPYCPGRESTNGSLVQLTRDGHLEPPVVTCRGASRAWSTEPPVLLSDFGLAKDPAAQPHRHTGELGTVMYRPPAVALSDLARQGAGIWEHRAAAPAGAPPPPLGRHLLLGPSLDLHGLGVSVWQAVSPAFSSTDCTEMLRDTVRGTAHATGDPAALPTRATRPVAALAMLLTSDGLQTAAEVVSLLSDIASDCLCGGGWGAVEGAAVQGAEWPTGVMAVGMLVTLARAAYTRSRRGSARDRTVADAAYRIPGEVLTHFVAGILETGGAVPAPHVRLVPLPHSPPRQVHGIGMARWAKPFPWVRVRRAARIAAGRGVAATLTAPLLQLLGQLMLLLPTLLEWQRTSQVIAEAEAPSWLDDLLREDSGPKPQPIAAPPTECGLSCAGVDDATPAHSHNLLAWPAPPAPGLCPHSAAHSAARRATADQAMNASVHGSGGAAGLPPAGPQRASSGCAIDADAGCGATRRINGSADRRSAASTPGSPCSSSASEAVAGLATTSTAGEACTAFLKPRSSGAAVLAGRRASGHSLSRGGSSAASSWRLRHASSSVTTPSGTQGCSARQSVSTDAEVPVAQERVTWGGYVGEEETLEVSLSAPSWMTPASCIREPYKIKSSDT